MSRGSRAASGCIGECMARGRVLIVGAFVSVWIYEGVLRVRALVSVRLEEGVLRVGELESVWLEERC